MLYEAITYFSSATNSSLGAGTSCARSSSTASASSLELGLSFRTGRSVVIEASQRNKTKVLILRLRRTIQGRLFQPKCRTRLQLFFHAASCSMAFYEQTWSGDWQPQRLVFDYDSQKLTVHLSIVKDGAMQAL